MSFSTRAATHVVYDTFDEDERPRDAHGVRVEQGGHESDLRCVGPVVSRFAQLEKRVPCDTDNEQATCD